MSNTIAEIAALDAAVQDVAFAAQEVADEAVLYHHARGDYIVTGDTMNALKEAIRVWRVATEGFLAGVRANARDAVCEEQQADV